MSQCCVHLMTFGCLKGLTSVSAGLRLLAAVVIGICASTGSVLAADASLDDIKVIRIVPRTAEEIARAHERARGDACEPIPSAQPLEIKSFTPILTERDSREWENGKLLLPSSRRHMFTVGLDMLSSDRSQLPRVSGGQILDYIRGHYVTVQARIQKDPVTSELFLHHRPLAATVAFGRGGLTQEFTDAVLAAVRDFHSLGIYLPRGNDPSPKNLRTLVMTYRSYVAPPTPTSGRTSLRSNYEYVFVRGRSDKDTKSGELDLHIFATSEQRKKIHYFSPWGTPKQPRDCGIHATVVFTKYTTLGLIPSESATREVRYESTVILPWQDLDHYAIKQRWGGDALDNLDQTLDAIIDGKLAGVASLSAK